MMPQTFQAWISLALWSAAAGHFCVLIASFQVPRQLRWKTDLLLLAPLNRKLMWVYGGFTVYTIVAFGAMTFYLHDDMLRGDRPSIAVALFIAVYWLLRLVVDFTYYSHSDWPKGKRFVIGHALLSTLFIFLSATYFVVALRIGVR
jgi:alginate O-acetyltransferase complex protein AlgI